MLCEFSEGVKLYCIVEDISEYLMSVRDQNGVSHIFFKLWFDEISDEWKYDSPMYNPDGIHIKFTMAETKELPFKWKLKVWTKNLFSRRIIHNI